MNIREKLNNKKREKIKNNFRNRLKCKDFTIISQNCIGGVIYDDLGLEFSSPTINMFIEDENFVKLVENLEYYMKIKPTAITDCYVDPIDNNVKYPVIGIDDIKICCLHYKDCNDAITAWERRKKRINYDNIIVIGNSWNMHENKKLIYRLGKVKYNKIIFTYNDYNKDYCIKLPGDFWYLDERSIVRPNITDFMPDGQYKYFEKFFDFVDFINENCKNNIVKKVLFVAHERMINGSSYSMINLIDCLSDKCNFIIVTPFKDGPLVDELNKRNVDIYYVPFYRWVDIKDKEFYKKKLKWKSFDNINEQLAIKFSEIIKKEKIDIIHSNTSVVDFGYRVSKILNIPHVWHIREFGEKDFSMYPLCSYCKYYKKIKDNNYLICISNEVSKKFINKVEKNKLRIIYNGVDKININKNKYYHLKENEKIVCLQSGMIHKTKGQDLTIRAIEKLNNEGYKIDLLIAGTGNIEELGIDVSNKKWLKILGQVNNLQEIRKNVDIEIVSSKSEAFGRVVVEAMMGSIPVIGSNSGAIKEIINDNNNGLLFEGGNYISLYEKIKYLYDNRNEIKRIGKNAYNDSHNYYVIDRCANEIYDFYNYILKEK